MTNELGSLILAGSGEYTPMMDIVDRCLLERLEDGREILLIATSCAQEGDDVMERWEQMGVQHFKRLGVDAAPLRIRDHDDANRDDFAARIEQASFVWFSGGSPTYLAQSFHDTSCFRALEAANRRGAAVAGASGGLGVLNDHVPMPQQTAPAGSPQAVTAVAYDGPNALGLAAPLRAMAHFDRGEIRRPEFAERVVTNLRPGQTAVGVDEDTALVWIEGGWRAMGHKRVVVFARDGSRTIFANGDRIKVLPAPLRAGATPAK